VTERADEDAELIRRYAEAKELYDQLVTEVEFALDQALTDQGVKVADLSGRAKSVESLGHKLQRKSYSDLDEIPDLAGVRVVTLFAPDTEKVLELIEANFRVVDRQAPEDVLGVDRMGYAAHHLVVELGSAAFQGPRYRGIRNLRCEVQVRTAIQDAWARVSHSLVYKQEESIPPAIRRRLNNVSALLEIAQDTFDSVSDLRSDYVEEASSKAADPDEFLSLPVDSDTVLAYSRNRYPDQETSERIHGLLMRDLDTRAYPTLRELDTVINAVEDEIEAYAEEEPDLFKFATDYLTKSLGLKDPHFRARHPFGRKTREFFSRTDG